MSGPLRVVQDRPQAGSIGRLARAIGAAGRGPVRRQTKRRACVIPEAGGRLNVAVTRCIAAPRGFLPAPSGPCVCCSG